MAKESNYLKIYFYIDTEKEEELRSYDMWRKTLDVGPITTDNFHTDMLPVAQMIAKKLDGLGVTLSEVKPIRISKKKNIVKVLLKYIEEEQDGAVS